MGARSRRSRSVRPVLRAVPLAVLCTIVVVALVARRTANVHSDRVTTTQATTEATRPSGGTSAFDAPLRGPSPPPNADVPAGAPRTLHGGPRRTHRAAARGPRATKTAWRARVDGPVAAQVTSSPDETTLYVATLNGSVVALSREDGSRRWSASLGDRVYATPLVHDDGTIYVGSDAKKLVALSPKGEVIFRLETEGEVDTAPVLAKDGTIVFAAGKDVYAVRRGGDVAWRFRAKNKVFTAPAISEDGLVVVGSQDHHVHAIGPGGVLAWTVDLGVDVDGGAAIADDGSIYVGTDAGDVVKLDPKGHIAWRTPVSGFVRGSLSIARNGDVMAGTYGPVPHVVRLSPDGSIRGAFAIRGTGAREFGIHGGPLEDAEGTLYFGAQDDAVRAVAVDGMLRWRFDTGGDVDAPLSMLSDGSLVAPSEDGTVTLLLP